MVTWWVPAPTSHCRQSAWLWPRPQRLQPWEPQVHATPQEGGGVGTEDLGAEVGGQAGCTGLDLALGEREPNSLAFGETWPLFSSLCILN